MGCENGNALCWHRSQTIGRARPSQAVGHRPDQCLLCGLVAETEQISLGEPLTEQGSMPALRLGCGDITTRLRLRTCAMDQCLLCGLVAETHGTRSRVWHHPRRDQCLLCGLVAETARQTARRGGRAMDQCLLCGLIAETVESGVRLVSTAWINACSAAWLRRPGNDRETAHRRRRINACSAAWLRRHPSTFIS